MLEKFGCCFDFVLQFEIHFFAVCCIYNGYAQGLILDSFYHTGIYLTTLIIAIFDRSCLAVFKQILKILKKLSSKATLG